MRHGAASRPDKGRMPTLEAARPLRFTHAMTGPLTRRSMISGLLAGCGSAALAEAPLTSLRPRPRNAPEAAAGQATASLIEAARLGGRVTAALADARTGELLDAVGPEVLMPPASTAKAPTSVYALNLLPQGHRFATRALATGPVRSGRLEGDLVLSGSGDPTLDTDALGQLAADLKAAGVTEVEGRFLFDASAMPELPWIDPDQPEYVGYNPAISGLNLNYNRVHFEWKRGSPDYETTMEARAVKYRPGVSIARMDIVDRTAPVFAREERDGVELWTVSRAALGREGARWLPVRHPAQYAAEVFRTLATAQGIRMPAPGPVRGATGAVVAEWQSQPLEAMLSEMLDYSTNLTAEMFGLTAGATLGAVPEDLAASASRMDGWLSARFGLAAPGLVDHSGLGYGNKICASDMVRILSGTRRLEPLLDEVRVNDAGLVAHAKTGTLNFVSALTGYFTAVSGRPLVFAIFAADIPRRDAIPPEARERPPGARAWANRARALQKTLISNWAAGIPA